MRAQSHSSRRARNMSPLLLLLALTYPVHTALVTEQASFSERIDKLYNKLEALNRTPTRQSKLYDKLDKLNSIGNQELSDEDEELLATIQMWGMLKPQELEVIMRDLRAAKSEGDVDVEYDWNEDDLQDIDYAMDGIEEDEEDEEAASSMTKTVTATLVEPPEALPSPSSPITPSAIIRTSTGFRQTVVSAIDPVAATNERPRILDDSSLTPKEKKAVGRAALTNMGSVVRSGKCLWPQPRWLSIKQMAPAANIVYMPPCVQLYRCAHDTGCCYNDSEMCAPIGGKYVAIPLYLHDAKGNFSVARMLFFNHTRCACVSKSTLQTTRRNEHTIELEVKKDDVYSRKAPEETTSRRAVEDLTSKMPTEEPSFENDEESNAPQLRRCTCPKLFHGILTTNTCTCNCDWTDPYLRRDCLSLSRGREHFGLKDRVCVAGGVCSLPTCEYGPYDMTAGRCPTRWYKRIRLNAKRHMEKVV